MTVPALCRARSAKPKGETVTLITGPGDKHHGTPHPNVV